MIAGFKDIEKTADLTEGGLVVSPNENNRRAEAFRKLLGDSPKARHQHRSHHSQAQHPRRAREGLVRREGRRGLDLPSRERQLRLVARVQMEEWPRIAAAK